MAGLILMVVGGGGWLLFMAVPTSSNPMSPEYALSWLVLFSIVTLGALLLAVIGLVLAVLGLVLRTVKK